MEPLRLGYKSDFVKGVDGAVGRAVVLPHPNPVFQIRLGLQKVPRLTERAPQAAIGWEDVGWCWPRCAKVSKREPTNPGSSCCGTFCVLGGGLLKTSAARKRLGRCPRCCSSLPSIRPLIAMTMPRSTWKPGLSTLGFSEVAQAKGDKTSYISFVCVPSFLQPGTQAK